MKPTSEILERIAKCSNDHKDGVFTRLYRYLLREDIYYAAKSSTQTKAQPPKAVMMTLRMDSANSMFSR